MKRKNKKIQKKILVVCIVIIIIVFLSSIYIISSHNKRQMIGEKIYADPDAYYTMTIPTIMQTKESVAIGKTGIGTSNETTQKIELVNIATQSKVGINVSVYEGTPSCTNSKPTNAILNGFPASYDFSRRLWIINTTNATYLINYYYPGLPIFYNPRYLEVIPPPQSVMDADQKFINSIITTFLPKNSQPLRCQ